MSTLNCLLCLHIMLSTHWKMHFFLASPADMGRISCNTTGGTASPRHGHGPAAVPRRVRDGNGDTNGVAPPGGKTAPLPFALRRGGLQVRWLPQARTMQRNMMCLLTIFQRRVTPSHGCAESFLSGKTEKVFLPEALFFCDAGQSDAKGAFPSCFGNAPKGRVVGNTGFEPVAFGSGGPMRPLLPSHGVFYFLSFCWVIEEVRHLYSTS